MEACSNNKPAQNCETYVEAADPSPDKTTDWEAVEPGLHASIGDIDQHYFKSSVPQVTENDSAMSPVTSVMFIFLQIILMGISLADLQSLKSVDEYITQKTGWLIK